jgi:hypothetical protein
MTPVSSLDGVTRHSAVVRIDHEVSPDRRTPRQDLSETVSRSRRGQAPPCPTARLMDAAIGAAAATIAERAEHELEVWNGPRLTDT